MEVIDFVLRSPFVHPKHRGELWERKVIDHEKHLGQPELVQVYFCFVVLINFIFELHTDKAIKPIKTILVCMIYGLFGLCK